MKAFDPGSTWTYILKDDQKDYRKRLKEEGKHTEPPTVFTLRPLTARKKAQLQDKVLSFEDVEFNPDDEAANKANMRMAMAEHALEYCKWGIHSWENVYTQTGKVLKPLFEKGALKDESLDVIEPYKDELMKAILDRTEVTIDDLKKSVCTSPSPPTTESTGDEAGSTSPVQVVSEPSKDAPIADDKAAE